MSARQGQVTRSWIPFLVVGLAVLALTLHTGRSLGSSPPQPTCSDDSYEPDDDCAGYSYRLFQVGSAERHQLCDPDWISFEAVDGIRYRIETSGLVGGADTVIELWGLDSSNCGSRLAFDDNGGGGLASRIEWTADVGYSYGYDTAHVMVSERSGEYRDGMGYRISITRTQRSYVVPVVAHAPGAGGELWVSDLWLHNPTDEALELELVLTPTGPSGPQHRVARTVPIGSRETLTLSDPVSALFQATGSGWLEVRTPGVDLVAASRICSNGTCQGIPVHPKEEALVLRWPGAFLLPVTGATEGRTNLGLVDLSDRPGEVVVRMWDDQGQQIARRSLDLAAGAHVQVNDVFNFLGVPRRDAVLVGVVSTTHGRGIGAYASVVDDLSSDASFSDATTYAGYGFHYAVVPLACGSTSGLQTDLVVSNYPYPRTLTLEFQPPAGSGEQPVSFNYGIGADQTVVFDDVVTGLGGVGCGALIVSGSHVVLTSRTFRNEGTGTLGDVVPATLDSDLVGRGDGPLTIPGIDGTSGTITAVGWVNPTSSPGTVTVRLVSAGGATLGKLDVELEARRWGQLDDVFAALGTAPGSGIRAELEVVVGDARITAYATVASQANGDFVVLPALPIPRPQVRDVRLSARDVIIVDQIPEAVGEDALPSGTFTASLSGAGNLGADDLPIRAACVFYGVDGRLRSAALGIGESVSDIGGGQPFWCFIPDWIRSDDNWGAVEVELQGPQTITLQLDPITNCVLLDRDPSSVIEAAPAPSYLVEATGNFGGPQMVPQVLVMYKNAVTHGLEVVTVEHGDLIGPLWTSSQLLAVGLDRGLSTDNTGAMWLRVTPPSPKAAGGRARGATASPER